MNHKWKDNVCVNCGLHRMIREYRKVVRTYSKLRNGVWEDVPIYQYGKKYWYGTQHEEVKSLVRSIGFERPDCKKIKHENKRGGETITTVQR
jgi:hypothetical protein